MGSVVGMLQGGGPSYHTVELDQGTRDLIHGQSQRNTVPTSQIAEKLNAGVGKDTNSIVGASSSADNNLMQSPGSDQMRSAIVNKYKQESNKQIGMLQQAQGMQAPLTQGNWLAQAYQSIQAQQQIETQNNEFLTQAYIDNQRARSQAMSSIFGAVGGVAGVGAARGWFKGGQADSGIANPSSFGGGRHGGSPEF